MLTWALICLAIALVTGYFGFTGVATMAATISQVFFVLFLVGFMLFLGLAVAERVRARR